MNHNLSFNEYYSQKLKIFETYLEESFPFLPSEVAILAEAMKYSLLAGGKRLRPILLLTTIECTGTDSDFALPFAGAIEYIHTYSLIHDDLPCMDNDELRRGIPTNHIRFGEDIALLAGDALLTHCFYLISEQIPDKVSAETALRIINILAGKAGVYGMVSGQVADIRGTLKTTPQNALDFIHTNKTGALILSSIQIGALLANVNKSKFKLLTDFGEQIGKCFQIQDDILDETGKKELMGKTPGSDKRNDTLTYPSVFGLEKSYDLANQCYEKAIASLDQSGLMTERLKELARFVLKRDH
ncbi:polyprenyl synthetase family protein [bacterium]|nr:polyprenyl synthetase family protein [bacterium]